MKGADWCLARMSEVSLKKHVGLCDNLDHQECLAVISRSALFLRPTLYDGDSLSVREALALGVPVVASTTDFRPDGVTLYRTGVFEDLVAKAFMALGKRGTSAICSANDYSNLEQVRQIYLKIMEN